MSKKPFLKRRYRRRASLYILSGCYIGVEKKYKKTPPICQSVEQYIPDIVVVVPFFAPDLRALNIFQCLSNEGNLRYFP